MEQHLALAERVALPDYSKVVAVEVVPLLSPFVVELMRRFWSVPLSL